MLLAEGRTLDTLAAPAPQSHEVSAGSGWRTQTDGIEAGVRRDCIRAVNGV